MQRAKHRGRGRVHRRGPARGVRARASSGRRCAPARSTSASTCSARRWRARSSRARQVEVARRGRRRRARARLHRQGQRPGALRARPTPRSRPTSRCIAPWREWDIQLAEDALDYARARGIPVTATKEKIYSRDRNLWHISHEGGVLEDPGQRAAGGHVHADERRPKNAPDTPEYVEIGFEHGYPVAVNGERSPRSRWSSCSTRSAAGTASAASTSSRIAWSA